MSRGGIDDLADLGMRKCAYCIAGMRCPDHHPAPAQDALQAVVDSPEFFGPRFDELKRIHISALARAQSLQDALENIAGFPSQLFDVETPWKMREIAEKALKGGAQ